MMLTIACEPALTDETGVEHELFRVEIRPSASCDLLVLAGEISLESVHQLNDAALRALAGGREVAIDWGQATRVSAGALQVLLALRTALVARGTMLRVLGDNPGVRRTLEYAGLSHLFPVREGAG